MGVKLTSTRSRFRDPAKVSQADKAILRDADLEAFLVVEIKERTTETRYVRSEATRYDLTWRIDHDRLIEKARFDRVFSLVTNETSVSAVDLLLAYKQ